MQTRTYAYPSFSSPAPNSSGQTISPLGMAASKGHWTLVRELLVRDQSMRWCKRLFRCALLARSEPTYGRYDLAHGRWGVSTGRALIDAPRWGGEAAVKFLLQ